MWKHTAILLSILISISAIPFIPNAIAVPISQPLVSFSGTALETFSANNLTNHFGTDLGSVTYAFSCSQISWADNWVPRNNFTLKIPNFAGLGFPCTSSKNSTTIDLHFSGSAIGRSIVADFYFKQVGYNQKITIRGTISGSVISIPLVIPLGNVNSVCGNQTLINGTTIAVDCTKVSSVFQGHLGFDWSDIASPLRTYNNVTKLLTITIGNSFNLDPIAVDGTANKGCANVSSCTITGFSTTSTNDVVILYASVFECGTISSVTVNGNAMTSRGNKCSTANERIEEWYYVSASALSSVSVVITFSAKAYSNNIVFGVSGADTSIIFDSNAGLPASATGTSSQPTTSSVSTSNANDMIIAGAACHSSTTFSGGTIAGNAANLISGPAPATTVCVGAIDLVVSSTQSSISAAFTETSSNWAMMTDAIVQQITETVTISMANGGMAQGSLSITGCHPSVTTIAADGSAHAFTSDSSCSITYTVAADSTNTRDRFASVASTWTYTTGSSDESKSNTLYHQLSNTYQFNPQTPSTWDGAYTLQVLGTLSGTGGQSCTATTSNGGGQVSASCFFDYNLAVTFSTFLVSSGEQWLASGTTSFTDTTGGNTRTGNYVRQWFITVSAGTGGTVSPRSLFVNDGGTQSFTATANSGFAFASWAISGSSTLSSTSASPTTLTANSAGTISATFVAGASHNIQINPTGNTINIPNYGTTVTLNDKIFADSVDQSSNTQVKFNNAAYSVATGPMQTFGLASSPSSTGVTVAINDIQSDHVEIIITYTSGNPYFYFYYTMPSGVGFTYPQAIVEGQSLYVTGNYLTAYSQLAGCTAYCPFLNQSNSTIILKLTGTSPETIDIFFSTYAGSLTPVGTPPPPPPPPPPNPNPGPTGGGGGNGNGGLFCQIFPIACLPTPGPTPLPFVPPYIGSVSVNNLAFLLILGLSFFILILGFAGSTRKRKYGPKPQPLLPILQPKSPTVKSTPPRQPRIEPHKTAKPPSISELVGLDNRKKKGKRP